jgi:hypothetical protein
MRCRMAARGRRYQVQAADLVARPPGAGAHILAGSGRERVATVGMSQAGERCCHHEQQGGQAPDGRGKRSSWVFPEAVRLAARVMKVR